jgi:hypothetical protein
MKVFNQEAIKNGFNGVYFIITHGDYNLILDNDSILGKIDIDLFTRLRKSNINLKFNFLNSLLNFIRYKTGNSLHEADRKKPRIIDYKKINREILSTIKKNKVFPCIFPNWDNSPRSKNKSLIFKNSNPKTWEVNLCKLLKEYKKVNTDVKILIIKSWNEWAEGNYLEPDSLNGLQWLKALRNARRINEV